MSAKTSNHAVCRGSSKSRTESLLPQISAKSSAANSPGPGQSSPFSANSLRLLSHVSAQGLLCRIRPCKAESQPASPSKKRSMASGRNESTVAGFARIQGGSEFLRIQLRNREEILCRSPNRKKTSRGVTGPREGNREGTNGYAGAFRNNSAIGIRNPGTISPPSRLCARVRTSNSFDP